ncbi:CapA family protein [Paenibacillus gansuensis]|uniref:CapA family protein n=1 Tax=Paenibacillus gansuensis TaxID=306542 RepID=A0ABW5PJ05_9BACL
MLKRAILIIILVLGAAYALSLNFAVEPPKPPRSDLSKPPETSPSPSVPKAANPMGTPKQQVKQHSPIELIFAGDTMMDGSLRDAIRKRGALDPFRQVKEEITRADWAVANLETSVTTATRKDPNQRYNFKSDPSSLKGLKEAGFDMVSLANNHVLDYGISGLKDTLRYVKSHGLHAAGAGMNEQDAFQAATVTLHGQVVKVAAFTRFMPVLNWNASGDQPGVAGAYDQEKVLQAIRKQSQDADYLIVYIHWGVEKSNHPEPWQKQFARDMIDAGADAVIGSHPHVLQGFEYYRSAPIAYSIGNFLFPDYVKDDTANTGLLKLSLQTGSIRMSFHPLYIRDNRIIHRGNVYEKEQLLYLKSLSPQVSWKSNLIVPKKR